MKTITFYSYKGGVGRSLVLANLAQRLVEFGKSVCMLDFDLEAPGLPFKFDGKNILSMEKKGIVDFVTEYQSTKKAPQTLDGDYYIRLNENSKYQKPLHLITAGNTNNTAYWKNLAAIDWKEMFYEPDGNGYRLMLHLKALIEKELKPDYLLVDSRTGVTDITGITLSVLADEVVVVSANNKENIYGSKLIMKGVWNTAPEDEKLPLHFVLSRVPFTEEPEERLKEKDLIDNLITEFLEENISLYQSTINVIHSERSLEEEEELLIGEFQRDRQIFAGVDYRNFFKILFLKDFNEEERKKFERQEKANEIFDEYLGENDIGKSMSLINQCIELLPTPTFYIVRASINVDLGKMEEATSDYYSAIDINPYEEEAYLDLANLLLHLEKYDEGLRLLLRAKEFLPNEPRINRLSFEINKAQGNLVEAEKELHEAISIAVNKSMYYYLLAQFYFELDRYKESYNTIHKAIELAPNRSNYILLLAKLQLKYKKNDDEFYLNLDRALSLRTYPVRNRLSHDEFFRPFLNEERFQRILYKYNIKMKLPEKPEEGKS